MQPASFQSAIRTAADTVDVGFWCGSYTGAGFFLITLLLPLPFARRFAILGSAGWVVVSALGLACFLALLEGLVRT